jgi:hypothetical protein
MHRPHLRTALVITPLLQFAIGSPAAALVNCKVDAVDVFKAARDADFTFKLIQTDATSCELDESTIVIAAPLDRNVRCRFAVLADQALGNGWQLVKLNYSASDGADVELTKGQSGWLFDIRAPRARTSLVSIRSIIARGNKCKHWREAFNSEN